MSRNWLYGYIHTHRYLHIYIYLYTYVRNGKFNNKNQFIYFFLYKMHQKTFNLQYRLKDLFLLHYKTATF